MTAESPSRDFFYITPPPLKRKSSPESSPDFPTGPSDMDISSRDIINQNTDPASENGTGDSEVIMFLCGLLAV